MIDHLYHSDNSNIIIPMSLILFRNGGILSLDLYPRTERVVSDADIRFRSVDGVEVRACFIDLFDVYNSVSNISRHFSV